MKLSHVEYLKIFDAYFDDYFNEDGHLFYKTISFSSESGFIAFTMQLDDVTELNRAIIWRSKQST